MELSSDFKEQVRSQTEIVDLIGESVTLIPERGGQEFKCLCPFHDDNNPSMRVYPARQSYRCWVCDEGGDVFSWVMKREGLEFRDALELLATRAHIEIPKRSKHEASKFAKKNELYEVLKWAELQFHEYLLNSPDAEVARLYLDERGYTEETIQRFKLGFHPNDWQWIINRAGKQFSTDLLFQARLVSKKQGSSRYYDYFVNRVMFPIRDEQRRTVAFGGRIIPGQGNDDQAKYFNSVESSVFYKSQVLFGLPDAKDAIKEHKCVLVTEGYADCIACHQFGVHNVVATLGTSLTERHVSRLKAFAPKIVMVYDGDAAGQRAADRAVGMLLAHSADLRVLTLPDGKDPDDFLQESGTDAFRASVENAPEAWEFKLQYEIAQRGTDSINSQQQVAEAMLETLASVPRMQGTAREDLLLNRLSSRLRMSEKVLRAELDRVRKKPRATFNRGQFDQRNSGQNRQQGPNSNQGRFQGGNQTGSQAGSLRHGGQPTTQHVSGATGTGRANHSSPGPNGKQQGTNQGGSSSIQPDFDGMTVYSDESFDPSQQGYDGGFDTSFDFNSLSASRSQAGFDPSGVEDDQGVVNIPPVDLHKKRLSKDDMLELEILEILFTQPNLAEQTAQEIGVDDIQHPHLKMLLQVVYDLVELGEEPRFERVTLELEHLELKGLAVWIADQARLKGIEHKLLGDKTDEGLSVFYAENLKRLKWRREELSHQQQLNRDAMSGQQESDGLSKLKQASDFHRKRVLNQR